MIHDYKGLNSAKLIHLGKLRWVGHVVRMPEERQAKIMFSREPGRGGRLRGSPRTWWLLVVEEDLRALNVQSD